MDQEDISLATIGAAVPSNRPDEDEDSQFENGQLHEFSLPRADGAKDAWLFLAGCFALEALIWGTSFSSTCSPAWRSPRPMHLCLSRVLSTYFRVSFRIWCLPILLQHP